MGRRAGFHSGYIEAVNMQAGTLDFTASQTTQSVTFDEPMENAPAVVFGRSITDTNSTVFYSTRSTTGFTAQRSDSGSAETLSWVAVDDAGA